ncbi:TPA: hypothetical protein ACSP17_001580 [Aeromonas hydrophila]
MEMLERLEYTLKAGVGGAGLGIASVGGVSFIPAVSISLPVVTAVAALFAIVSSIYVYKKI